MSTPETPKEELVTIPKKEYNRLLNRDAELNALENAGVDNWDGYQFAMEEYRAYLDENEDN